VIHKRGWLSETTKDVFSTDLKKGALYTPGRQKAPFKVKRDVMGPQVHLLFKEDKNMTKEPKGDINREQFEQLQLFETTLISSMAKTTYSLEEAAAYLKIPVSSVEYYAKRKRELSYVLLGKGILVFLKSDLDDFLKNKRIQGIAA
jgi:hypothetical protein